MGLVREVSLSERRSPGCSLLRSRFRADGEADLGIEGEPLPLPLTYCFHGSAGTCEPIPEAAKATVDSAARPN